jgi:4-hydroxy-3-methylbut-2-en-1-yl diphosphate reductase
MACTANNGPLAQRPSADLTIHRALTHVSARMSGEKPSLKVLLAAPRGFCAGVVRAISIVEEALKKYGPPVYVRHEIVHNGYVVDDLKRKGAVFVEELDEIPEGNHPVIFSAHGVPKAIPEAARQRKLLHVDATCPLVTKVHIEAERHFRAGREIILVGHGGHPEVIGTMGRLPRGAISLIESTAQAKAFTPKDPDKLAYTTQTTLSVDDTREIVAVLQKRFPKIAGSSKEDICYATTNRQEAVKRIARICDALIVVGAPNSSNSQRLVETARASGCEQAFLVQRGDDIDFLALGCPGTIGITAGASAPEILVDEVIAKLCTRFSVTVERMSGEENVSFKLPRSLRDAAPAVAERST